MEIIADLKRDDPLAEINVLAGSSVLSSYLRRRLAQQGRTVANCRFHTFPDLVERLNGKSGPAAARARLPRLGPSIILEKILADHVPPVFAPLAVFRGFRDALLETFRDLRDAGIGPGELTKAMIPDTATSGRRRHLEGFIDLYRRFRAEAGRFCDVDDDFRSAAEAASAAAAGIGRLLVYGLYDVTGQQARLLSALKNVTGMIYFIPYVNEAVSSFAVPFLDACSAQLGVAARSLEPPTSVAGLDALAARRFGFSREYRGGEKIHGDGSVIMVSAPGESRAAVEVVREIFRALMDGTISRFRDVGVILRQPETDVPVLTEQLRLHEVPYYIHGGGSFCDRPLSKAVVAVIGLGETAFSREAVLAAMELVAASLPESGGNAWQVQDWRVLTNNPRFLAGLKSWDNGTDALLETAEKAFRQAKNNTGAGDDSGDAEISPLEAGRRLETARLFRDAWLRLRHASADWPASLSWREWARFIENRLGRILETSDDWPLFLTVLDDIAHLQSLDEKKSATAGPDPAVGSIAAEVLKSALNESLSAHSFPVGRFQRGGVHLLSISAARGLRFPLVIIPGLDEGRFPARLRQDPLLFDAERRRLPGMPIRSLRIEEEKLLFDMAARSASKRLVLVTSRLDETSDRERLPSQFFLRIADALRGELVVLRDLTAEKIPGFRSVSLDNPVPDDHDPAVNVGEVRLRLMTSHAGSPRQALGALTLVEPVILSRPLAYDRARWERKLTSYDGRISDRELVGWTAGKIGIASGQVSASRLEEYARCPYYFFLKRVIELDAWEEQERAAGMDPLERGTAV
ncbi:MAG TPA: hypothetical protein VLL97_00625, partial [Acidobacteriota bacterium]|nr:hypothetical protein [Acidobacteriota bacterium]